MLFQVFCGIFPHTIVTAGLTIVPQVVFEYFFCFQGCFSVAQRGDWEVEMFLNHNRPRVLSAILNTFCCSVDDVNSK